MTKWFKVNVQILFILVLFTCFDNIIVCQQRNQDTIPSNVIELPQGCNLVLDPNINLTDTVSVEIIKGIRNLMPLVQNLIPADSATIKLAISSVYVLPVWGIGARTFSGFVNQHQEESVEIYYDPNNPNFTVELVMCALAHELHHVCRVQMPGFQLSILECMVNEGLADHFSSEVNHCEKTPWSSALTEEQIQQYMIRVKPLMHERYESWTKELDVWMLYGKPEPDPIPGWTGYSIGWKIVENYLKAYPTARASSLVFTSPEVIVGATPELVVDYEIK